MQISIYRFDPDVDESPRMEDVELDVPEGRDLMVLDVLELLKAQDPSHRVSPFLSRGGVRVGRNQHERQERPGLHYADLRSRVQGQAYVATIAGTAGSFAILSST